MALRALDLTLGDFEADARLDLADFYLVYVQAFLEAYHCRQRSHCLNRRHILRDSFGMIDSSTPKANDGLEFEFDLPFLEEHPRRAEILSFLESNAADLSSMVGDDIKLLARIYAAVGVGLYMAREESAEEEPPMELAFAETLENVHNLTLFAEQDEPDHIPERRLTAWDISNRFGKTGVGQKLHVLHYGADVEGSRVVAHNLVDVLRQEAPLLVRAEDEFMSAAQDAQMPVEASEEEWLAKSTPDEIEGRGKYVLFSDRHLYNGYFWRHTLRKYINLCVMQFDYKALAELLSVLDRLPPLFRTLFPTDLSELPAHLREIERALGSKLASGLGISDARAFAVEHGLARFDIVAKTWLDKLCVEGRASKGRRDGKVAYWPPK